MRRYVLTVNTDGTLDPAQVYYVSPTCSSITPPAYALLNDGGGGTSPPVPISCATLVWTGMPAHTLAIPAVPGSTPCCLVGARFWPDTSFSEMTRHLNLILEQYILRAHAFSSRLLLVNMFARFHQAVSVATTMISLAP